MRKLTWIAAVLLTFFSACSFAGNTTNNHTEKKEKDGEVITMNKQMFIEQIFDYENSSEWKYLADKPAIIDLYADWCGPCRLIAPSLKELAKEYEGQIVVYKVNVDKERELAALFNATSIPLLVFIPMEGEPQLFKGAADKATYKQVIEEFLLKK
ncbi:MAG: thioredoxin domain-containing protein [Bacteroides sp.]|nr:thioredoxin domain-containing protein [Bacteroides sp.]